MAEKIRLPSSEGGLVRYSDEDYQGKYQVKPAVVVGICIAVIVIFIIIEVFGKGLLG
jgi:preprotein translocase subunit Sec61beta